MPFQNVVAEIALGQSGLSGSKNKSLIAPTEVLTSTNTTYEGDILGKEGGKRSYNLHHVPGGGLILGGYDWFPTPTTQRMVVVTSAGRFLKDTGDGYFTSTLATGLSTDQVPTFVAAGNETISANRKLFMFNGYDSPRVLSGDGITAAAVATPPVDWSGTNQPITGCIHEDRIFAALGHRIYWSTPGNHEDFTGVGAGQAVIFPGVGTRILQILSFKGVLLVFKEKHGIYLFDTSQYDYTSNTIPHIMALNTTIGISSPHSVVQIDDDLLFMDNMGNVQLYSGIDNFNISGTNLSQLHQMNIFIRGHIEIANLYHMKSIYYAYKREVHLAVPQTNDNFNTARLVIDLNHVDNPRFRWSPRDVCEAMWLRQDSSGINRPIIGDDVGIIWNLDQDIRSIITPGALTLLGVDTILGDFDLGFSDTQTEGYLAEFTTPYMDFGNVDPTLAAKNKLGCEIELVAEAREGSEILCDVLWDGKFRHTVTFNLDPIGVRLGVFVLGTDRLGIEDVPTTLKRKIIGSGRRLQLRFYNDETLGDFAIARCFVRFKTSDERITSKNR